MVSSATASPSRVLFRVIFVLLILFVAFYIGRPLYWKLSSTVHEIRENKTTVKQGISQFVQEAQRSAVGWFHDESDPGFDDSWSTGKLGLVKSARRVLGNQRR